ncbi:MAG TPA: MSMEG_4193 family putative phosphomutase [Actinomycetota bacterium]|nr:MSMEG_4193 family putative phosphomutase [Actinomycetota bacterium]
MATLLLVRHGHTDAAGKRLTGRAAGVHLTEGGQRQAERLVARLDGIRVDAIVSSPLERCRETAAPLAKARGRRVIVRRGWIEVGYGEWTGRSISQLRRTALWRRVMSTPSNVRFPGGESLLEVQARAVDAAFELAAEHPRGTVVVVSHADVIRLLVAQLAGMHADHLQRLSIDPGSITAVSLASGVPRLLTVNDTGDLAVLRSRRGKVGG